MNKAAAFALLGILGALPGFAQTNQTGQPAQTDSQTLQAILVEIRGLHNDVRLSETTQILLTELEVQQTAVNRAMQKRDNLKQNMAQAETQQKAIEGELARFDDTASTMDPAQKKQMAQMQENYKTQITMWKSQEQQRGNDLADAENALRKEQDALSNIQDQLDAVVKKLQPAGIH
jgi:hypothetical protein